MAEQESKVGRDLLYRALAEFVQVSAEERKSKKRRNFAIVGLLGAYMAFNIGWMIYTDQVKAAPTKNYAAVVRVDGAIQTGKLASTAVLYPVLEDAFKDAAAGCVALVINSPGGMVGQSQMLHDRILKLARDHKKKVIAVGEDLMASGGYLIASAASRIYAPSTGAVGSIGVRMDGYDLTAIAEKLGIKDRTFTAGYMKDPLNPLKPVTPEAQNKVENDLRELHGEFIRMVKESRGDRIKVPDDQVYTGEVFTGMEGARIGLLDGTLDLDSAIKQDCGADSFVTYEPHLGLSDAIRFISGR